MSPVDPVRIEQLLQEALTHATHADRHRFLTNACGDDAGLWNAVWDLLRNHFGRDLQPTVLLGAGAANPGVEDEKPGDFLGDCQLVKIVGEGVGTTVWSAERPGPVPVALKIINTGANEFLMRQAALKPALMLLEHPNIARIRDSGMTKAGKPFLVTDLAAGVPITQFCDDQKIPLAARVNLFLQVCEAVHHAHEKGLAHGDLKPSNILVQWNEAAQPLFKITDFGFAQMMGTGVITADGQPRTPPAYLAPEQIGTGRMDMKGDVLALGVLLFELITGRQPFAPFPLVSNLEDLRRAVRDAVPLKASECLNTLPKAQLTGIALARRVDPARLLQLLEVHFDGLLMRTVQKQPHTRPESLLVVAEALQGYLKVAKDEEAPPTDMGSTVGSYLERNRSLFVTGAAITFLLIAGMTLIGWLWVRKNTNHPAMASKKRAKSEVQTGEFMEQMFASLTPEKIKGKDTTLLKEMLDDASERLDTLSDNPETEARMQETIGLTYLAMSHTTPAQTHLQGAVDNRQQALGPDHPDTLRAMRELATVFKEQGRHAESETLLRKTLTTQKRVLGQDHKDTFVTITVLAAVCEAQEQPMTSEKLFSDLWQLQKKVLGPDHMETLGTLGNYAAFMTRQDRPEEALELEKERLERTKRTCGQRDSRTLVSMSITASAYEAAGQPSEAEKLYTGAMQVMKQALGADHPDTLNQMDKVAALQRRQGRPTEALKLHQEVLESRKRTLGAQHPDTLLAMRHVAEDLDADGKKPAAEAVQQNVLEILRNTPGPEHADTLAQMEVLADTYESHGKHTEAVTLQREVLKVRRHTLGSSNPKTLRSMSQVARSLSVMGHKDEAEKAQAEVIECTEGALGTGDPDTLTQVHELALMQRQHGRHPAAEKTWAKMLQIQQKALGLDHPDTLHTMHCLAETLAAQGRLPDAEKMYRQALEIDRARSQPNPISLADSAARLGRFWLQTERALEAEPLLRESLELHKKHLPQDWRRHSAESLLGGALLNQRKLGEAGPLLRAGHAGMQARLADIPQQDRFHLRDSLDRMVRYVEATDGPAAAQEWKHKLAAFDQPRPLAAR
ncbi:MAG TPA: serine/threonine-protein kinase [Prosthecobacter sp.]